MEVRVGMMRDTGGGGKGKCGGGLAAAGRFYSTLLVVAE